MFAVGRVLRFVRIDSGERGQAHEQGYALIVAIWVTGLLALMATGFTMSVRSHVRSTAVAREQAVAEGLADAGVHLAMLDLAIERARKDRPPIATLELTCSVGDLGHVRATTTDEGGRVDLNRAGSRLLRSLLIGVGLSPAEAGGLAAAIIDFRDSDGVVEPGGAEAEDYARAGLPGLPKNAPFDSVSELMQVLGMTAQIMSSLRPHVTVHAAQSGVDVSMATSELVAMIARGSRLAGAAVVIDDIAGPELPREMRSLSSRRAFRIRSDALAGRARFTREAVVEFASDQAVDARIRFWRQVESDTGWPVSDQAPPPCRR